MGFRSCGRIVVGESITVDIAALLISLAAAVSCRSGSAGCIIAQQSMISIYPSKLPSPGRAIGNAFALVISAPFSPIRVLYYARLWWMAAAGRSGGGDSGGYFRAWIGGGYSSFCLRVFSFVSVHVFGRRSVSPPHWSGGGGAKISFFGEGTYAKREMPACFLDSPGGGGRRRAKFAERVAGKCSEFSSRNWHQFKIACVVHTFHNC